MDDKTFQAALAGLLHDIGKVEQRAQDDPWRPPAGIEREGQPVHAAWTHRFIDDLPQQYRQAARPAMYHHQPEKSPAMDQSLSELIALADKLSAGERADSESPTKQPPMQMLTIFDRICLEGKGKAPGDHYLPLAELKLDEKAIFPGAAWSLDEQRHAYRELSKALRKIAKQDIEDRETYLENLLGAMQRYTWCVPSAYYHSAPDISLYDHSRMTAALAVCLSELDKEQVRKLLAAVRADFEGKAEAQDRALLEQPIALLVGGDISGVQDFIYTISSKGATSALRGRSFYLQLLTEAVARYILRRLDLPITNLIYVGGGKFFLLARLNDKNNLNLTQKEISRILFHHHRGTLYLAVGSISLKAADLLHGTFAECWRDLEEITAKIKHKRFAELDDELKHIFNPIDHGGNEDQECQVCGLEHPKTKAVNKTSENPEGIRKCPACVSYEELGEELRQAKYLVLETLPLKEVQPLDKLPIPEGWDVLLETMGLRVRIFSDVTKLPKEKEAQILLAINDQNQVFSPCSRQDIGKRFIVNVTPVISKEEIQELQKQDIRDLPPPESIKPFDVMAIQANGIQRLGVLRMDVDNLGKFFSKGLGKLTTLSRIATLSFAVSLFFEGWVGELATRRNQREKANPHRGELLYSIYSGGDDLFFVGAWDEVVELARQIEAGFRKYTAEHPSIHASAGIVLIGGKYPLSQAAQDAKYAEDQAKALKWYNGSEKREKDAICFLGQTLPWEKFGLQECASSQPNQGEAVQNVHALMHLLVDLVKEKGANRSLIHRLITLHGQYLRNAEKRRQEGEDKNLAGQDQVLWGPWQWLGFYTLSQLADKSNNPNIRILKEQLKQDDFRSLEWAGLAARWAELILRE